MLIARYLKGELLYQTLKTLERVSVELTTKCNAACPMCSRFKGDWDKGYWNTQQPNKEMPLQDLDFKLFKSAFTPDILKNIKEFVFNGKLGDPLIHPDSMKFFKYIKTHSPNTCIFIFTNASLRSQNYWKELADVLGKRDAVKFSIDGLEDTNHIYRQRTDWNKIISNAKTFISNGGAAHWEFLVFKHNEHQVEQAKSFAEELKFERFEIRKTNRFKGSDDFYYTSVTGDLKKLSLPNNKQYVHNSHDDYYHTVPDVLDIDCNFQKENKVFLSFTGKLWPCSYISEYYPMNRSVLDIIEKYGNTFNDLRFNSISEIFEHEYFKYTLVDSWSTGNNIARECWKKCSKFHSNITQVDVKEI